MCIAPDWWILYSTPFCEWLHHGANWQWMFLLGFLLGLTTKMGLTKRKCTFLLTSSVIVWVLRVFPPFRHRWAVRADHTIPGWDDLCCQGDGESGAACSAPHRWSHHFQVSNINSEICSQVHNTNSEICYAVAGSHILKLVLCTNTMEKKKLCLIFVAFC